MGFKFLLIACHLCDLSKVNNLYELINKYFYLIVLETMIEKYQEITCLTIRIRKMVVAGFEPPSRSTIKTDFQRL